MKKVLIGSSVVMLFLATVSCGGGHTCDAYRKADYTKKQTKKEVVKKKVQQKIASIKKK